MNQKKNPNISKTMKVDNIYQKIKKVREDIGQLVKSSENTFQKYKYVPEFTYLKVIRPLLDKNNLIMSFEDTDIPVQYQKDGKEWVVSYQKQVIITDCETEKSLIFKFWGLGQNTDIAKAKGSAETYGVKYFLQKFFMIPVSEKENLDPDAMSNEKEQAKINLKTPDAITYSQTEELYQLFVSKRGKDINKQNDFFNQIDQLLKKEVDLRKEKNIGKTEPGNFRMRLAILSKEDYQNLKEWLNNLK